MSSTHRLRCPLRRFHRIPERCPLRPIRKTLSIPPISSPAPRRMRHRLPHPLGNVALAHKKCNNAKADRVPTACESFYAESMSRCFEDAHKMEALQGYRLHIRGKGFMYVRTPRGAEVISRTQYRTRLKRLAMEKRHA